MYDLALKKVLIYITWLGFPKPKETELSTEALPKAFLHSLRTLFDILDDERRGYVHISEIESRWQGSETQDLPGSVLECLRRVTPPHGCLTFERFVAGLRYSMLNPENGTKSYCSNNKHSFTNGPKPQPQQIHSDKTGGSATGVRPYEGHVRPLGPSNGANLHHSPQGGRAGFPRSQSETTTGYAGSRQHGRSREEQRRHTITNGVDYEMLKQMKELEQEKDSLLAGLDVVERAREWYQNQIHNVTERQRLVGQTSHCSDFMTESGHLNVLLPKLQEVSRCLNDLISCSGMEVTEKSERITQLEQEKCALIKQLFEARARNAHDGSALDSTFI
uniref:Suppressor APC domain-containing protein n=1 Tax=Electrophorus electricus TaxID=8005 RepID=A0AAY5F2V5_ELEEL